MQGAPHTDILEIVKSGVVVVQADDARRTARGEVILDGPRQTLLDVMDKEGDENGKAPSDWTRKRPKNLDGRVDVHTPALKRRSKLRRKSCRK
eukprot:970421-Prorocentrum_minimum.AAC.1